MLSFTAIPDKENVEPKEIIDVGTFGVATMDITFEVREDFTVASGYTIEALTEATPLFYESPETTYLSVAGFVAVGGWCQGGVVRTYSQGGSCYQECTLPSGTTTLMIPCPIGGNGSSGSR